MSCFNRKTVKVVTISVACILLTLAIAFIVFYMRVIFPTYKGSYSIADYEELIKEFSYDYEKKYDAVNNYWDAYFIAKKEISERFPEGIFAEKRFDFSTPLENKCDVYYDMQSDTWRVYAYPESLSDNVMICGGAYACIISSDGTVIACWGEP